MTKILSPSNSVLVIGRVLVEGDGDVSTAYDLEPVALSMPRVRGASSGSSILLIGLQML
jgi:hypothetical protein